VSLPEGPDVGGRASPGGLVLRIENLSKHFGGARALDGVSFGVGPREVHGLLGQNGSGKSTLIKVLAGFHEPDPGARLWVGGTEVALPIPPGGFRALGISFVHQHLGLIPSLTVLENLLIGDLATEDRWRIGWKAEARRTRDLFVRYGLAIDPSEPVSRLSPVERALLAIVRAFDQLREVRMAAGSQGFLVLDEPTPFLPAADIRELFRLVREIVRDGASVIFVSHDIDEVLEITDRATVLRDGRIAGRFETRSVTKDDIVRMIVGRRVELKRAPSAARGRSGDARVRVRGLDGGSVEGLSLDVTAGEIIGLTGLIGSGYDEVVYLLYGATRATAGVLEIEGERHELAPMSPTAAIGAGCVLVPGDRQNAGAVGTLSVLDNVSLPVLETVVNRWLIRGSRLAANATVLAERFDVRPRDPALPIDALSGGNQQKVVLAKWLQLKPRLILLDEPTQGVDIGAREQVFEAARQAARDGACVLCASSDFEQLEAICDRVVIFSRGRAVSELAGDDITKSAIAEHCYKGADSAREETVP
jgi:ribose transport system ATP-binding protein